MLGFLIRNNSLIFSFWGIHRQDCSVRPSVHPVGQVLLQVLAIRVWTRQTRSLSPSRKELAVRCRETGDQ